jgi:hypothetical protein
MQHIATCWFNVFRLMGFGLPIVALTMVLDSLVPSIVSNVLAALFDLGLNYCILAAIIPDLTADEYDLPIKLLRVGGPIDESGNQIATKDPPKKALKAPPKVNVKYKIR